MLGLRLEPELATQLDAFARQTKRTRSSIARDAVREYLDRHSLAAEMKRQLRVIEISLSEEDLVEIAEDTAARLRELDEIDGGYDWGSKGPPA